MDKVLEITNLRVHLSTDEGIVRAVDGVDLSLKKGEVLGLVGESGCGKTIMSLSIMGMLPVESSIPTGEIRFRGEDLVTMSSEDLQEIRGPGIAMIFQDPLTSLNPVFSISEQLTRPLMVHRSLDKNESRRYAVEMLEKVGISGAQRRIDEFPHQFSGGQRQRIMIAKALSLRPEILIADEPTTALDVSIQAQILELLLNLREEFGTSLIFISHNLAVVAGIAHRVAVMYGGWIVEESSSEVLFDRPVHPYTRALLDAVPSIYGDDEVLRSLPGRPPGVGEDMAGCRFFPRCPVKVSGKCDVSVPGIVEVSEGHRVRCFLV